MEDKKKIKNPYVKSMLAEAGAFAMAILLFFALFKAKGIGTAIGRLATILRPFIIGFIIAYLLVPVCRKLEKWFGRLFKGKAKSVVKFISIALSLIFALLVVYILIMMIVPQLYLSIMSLSVTVPDKAEELVGKAELMLQDNPTLLSSLETAYERGAEAVSGWVTGTLLPQFKNVIGGVGNGVVNVVVSIKDVFVGLVVAAYALADRKNLIYQAKRILYALFRPRWAGIIEGEVRFADKMFSGFMSGKILDSAIIGVICYVFCAIAGMPNTLLVSAVIGLTNIIPFFGPFIGAVPMSLLILIESPAKCLIFVIFIFILQQIDGNIIGPKILGNSTGLSSFSVLFAIILFGGLFGFIGMIIGVPLYAVIIDILDKLIKLGIKRNGMEEVGVDTPMQQ